MATEMDMKVSYQSQGTADDAIDVEVISEKKRVSQASTSEGLSSQGRSSSIFRCPRLFERASQRWLNPSFDSKEIEDQYQRSLIPELKKRFRYALLYTILMTISWVVYTAAMQPSNWQVMIAIGVVVCFIAIAFWLYSLTEHYKSCVQLSSVIMSLVLCLLTIVTFIGIDSYCDMNDYAFIKRSISTFAMCLEIILMMYTVLPMPLYLCAPIAFVFSFVYEFVFFYYSYQCSDYSQTQFVKELFTKIFLHLCIHLIGFHIFFMTQVRSHSTFWKITQATQRRHEFEVEKLNTEKMIHSVMPKYLAGEIMKVGTPNKKQTAFSEFFMMTMEPVSILFADIVGFTRMAGKKTADVLVDLLNDLFGRFDLLCEVHGCEKIATLGDCYYCVSGCPERRDDHAQCCVEMGLAMIDAIKEFCKDRNEDVDMRVGIHTGMVLCGIIGKKRFKFDVWSDSVSIANQMEGAGKKGMVHISAKTAEYLKDLSQYELTDGNGDTRNKGILGIKTHFIEKKKDKTSAVGLPHTPKSTAGSESLPENGNSSNGGDTAPAPNTTLQQPLLQITTHSENGGLSPADVEEGNSERTTESKVKAQEIEDRRLVSFMKQVNAEYLQSAPTHLCMLSFEESGVERLYRDQFKPRNLRAQLNDDTVIDEQQMEAQERPSSRRLSSETISTTKYNTLFDVGIGFLVYLFTSIGCFLVFDVQLHWAIVFAVGTILQLCVFITVLQEAFFLKARSRCSSRLVSFFHSWYPRHILGVVLISLPSVAVYSNVQCNKDDLMMQPFYCFITTVALLHYCNFIQLSSWTKTIMALLSGATLIIISSIDQCTFTEGADLFTNSTSMPDDNNNNTSSMPELILVVLLLVLLVLLLNRQFEISFRLNFYGGVQAAEDKGKIQEQKNKAEELLHNIVPKFVYESFKETASSKYSKNHENVGIIFGSIINFNEFYSEIFADGIECIRILNEMIGDFDALLEKEQFRDVEKIKTIGSTYMAACGLHFSKPEHERTFKYEHLQTLLDFSLQMQKCVETFNSESLSMTMGAFEFILRIGFHHGSINSGVIGTTKLFYDIWGDAVNIASRMDSTGVAKHIQVAEETVEKLNHLYDFKYRGEVTVKGKQAPMRTFFVIGKKAEPLPDPVPVVIP
ncbi:adenylate cyclase type 9-like isoform X2 [Antedon mediterranea]|uniref:adenylate cyclase type 9-like isoform X2 n=1 Tax=Antedon mediterranea TaxID=105859 RepID=UPI003AF90497